MEKRLYTTTRHSITKPTKHSLSSGSYYMVIYITKGKCAVEADSLLSNCGTENVIVLKPHSKCILNYTNARIPLEYIAITVSPSILQDMSGDDADLERSFGFLPNSVSVSRLHSERAMLIKNIAQQIMALEVLPKEYGHLLYQKNLYSIILLLTIRSCIESDTVVKKKRTRKLILDDIFAYISNHLTEDISLDTLEREFYVSKYYICREFKSKTGMSPHSYIVKMRLALCCKYIEQGIPIHEVYQLGGFGGYNHFFKAFKKEYNMTPKEYYFSAL